MSLLSFSLIFDFGGLLWPLFFVWASLASFIFHKVWSLILTCGGIIVSIILSSLGNALIMMIITLLFTYNSILQLDTRTMNLYECLWQFTRMCNHASVISINDEWWLSHKYYVIYMFTQNEYDNECVCHKNGTVEVPWQYISKWLWNAIIGRYGGYFKEDIRRLM